MPLSGDVRGENPRRPLARLGEVLRRGLRRPRRRENSLGVGHSARPEGAVWSKVAVDERDLAEFAPGTLPVLDSLTPRSGRHVGLRPRVPSLTMISNNSPRSILGKTSRLKSSRNSGKLTR
jgi:hypothetical protein